MRQRRTKKSAGLASPSRRITVISLPGDRGRAFLRCGSLALRCALGGGGVTHLKREGDGATPAGRHRLLALRVRADRMAGPATLLPRRVTRPGDGWCDDPRDGRYNRPVRLPFAASHEMMWRDDRLYDMVGILDWNVTPRAGGRGSAIFLHLARPDFAPTAGCIALQRDDLLRLLAAAVRRPEFLVATKPRKARGLASGLR
jgi:L,D-peptidoglycan transpeptidase YkuD (ErfK/YbiS/YcfS/YnhG family)